MTATRPSVPDFAAIPVLSVAAVVVVVLTALSGRYGYHRDELYFMVAGQKLDWGYVDQPPLTPLLARVSTEVFGNTPMGLRVVSTLASAITVVVVALIAREFGSSRRGQLLAAVCAAVSGFLLGVGHLVSTATYDLLAWMLICLFAVKLLRTGDGRWWLALGLTAGVALENKYLVVLPIGALLLALLIVGPRGVLRSWWLLAGIAVAGVVALPNVLWQFQHDWPQLTVAGGISEDDGTENRIMFIPLQLLQLSPFLIPVWVVGFRRLWQLPWARSVALAYPVLCLAVLAVGGKSYYALPLLLVLVAAGAEQVLSWSRRAVAAGLVLTAVTSAVFTLPVLPASAVDFVIPINKEQGEQIGWPLMADTVAAEWNRIPTDQRSAATIFTGNYGEAGALRRYGPALGLPPAYSGHMSFADWDRPPDTQTGPVLLVEIERSPAFEAQFRGCEQVATIDNIVSNDEDGAALVRCDSPAEPWSTLWPKLRRYY
ncbi:4-amino-4-deoxy-L-arabinose transferase-like glycosyltransferase [Kribbella steppae]|uniref:4-amino-4-deoxy-L-arabinose transferase-like glycosyltransferase n=1 Tax=Kribbella steppae TaxID=2512223 RepID=A0A4R2H0Q1_9ACTN|nr:glycosyltransferase family 39 protein [Kribbella steppae]TCO18051.1 4-amino-4-deoxy-L-arabinose transferase-like glycosyltransferase [Kribbella steppae]